MDAGQEFVIGVGLPRTGTVSMKLAVEELLKGPCYHFENILENPDGHIPFWMSVVKGEVTTEKWRDFLSEYKGGFDSPIVSHWKEIYLAFPNAKFILTERDPKKWFLSIQETILPLWNFRKTFLGYVFLNTVFYKMSFWNTLTQHWTNHTYNFVNISDKEAMIQRYHQHVDEVKRIVPKDRLLVFNVTQGWGPLCEFLNVPVPKKTFPRANDKKSYQNRIRKFKVWSIVMVATGVGLTGLFGWGLSKVIWYLW